MTPAQRLAALEQASEKMHAAWLHVGNTAVGNVDAVLASLRADVEAPAHAPVTPLVTVTAGDMVGYTVPLSAAPPAPTLIPLEFHSAAREFVTWANSVWKANADGRAARERAEARMEVLARFIDSYPVSALGAACDRYDSAEAALLAWHPAAPTGEADTMPTIEDGDWLLTDLGLCSRVTQSNLDIMVACASRTSVREVRKADGRVWRRPSPGAPGMTPAQRLTEETAIERRLGEVAAIERKFHNAMGDAEAEILETARDLVRCWREYLAALDEVALYVMEEKLKEARTLLARGDDK